MLSLKSIARRLREQRTWNAEQMDEVDPLVRDAFRGIKVIGARLRPPVLDIGLAAALEWYAEGACWPRPAFTLRSTCPTTCQRLNDPAVQSPCSALPRSLSNVVHHSRPNRCTSACGSMRVSDADIEDDGIGFDGRPTDGKPHSSACRIRERIASCRVW